MNYLGYRQVLWIYKKILEETGGSSGIRDDGLLRSALARPQATFGGKDLYPTCFEKAAALLESLAKNHPFVDGNKRMAWACFDIFLEINGYSLISSENQNFNLLISLIDREKTTQDVAEWLAKNTRRI